MRFPPQQVNDDGLAAMGAAAVELLKSKQFSVLAERFGYATALGRPAAQAIEQDLAACLSTLGHAKLPAGLVAAVNVKYLDPSVAGVRAVVECFALTTTGGELLVELVVTADAEDPHITLEQISVVG